MATRNTILVNGSPVEVTPLNWQQVAKARLAQDSNLSPENRLAEYQAIQQLGGNTSNLNYTLDANGAAVPNTQAYDKLLNNPLFEGADAVQAGETAVFGQGFVDALKTDSNLVFQGGHKLFTETIPNAAKSAAASLKEFFSGLNGTAQIALVAVVAVAVAFVVEKVHK